MKQVVICGFPGVGKSTLTNLDTLGYTVQDSDSSKMDKSHFPQNYIDLIKDSKSEIVLVSSHKAVREALIENGIEFLLVYPHKSLKQEYLQRYIDRGSPKPFVDLMAKNWDAWIDECVNQEGCHKVCIGPDQYLGTLFQEEEDTVWMTRKEEGSYSDHSEWVDSVHKTFFNAFLTDATLPLPSRVSYKPLYFTGGYTIPTYRSDPYWSVDATRIHANSTYNDGQETHIYSTRFNPRVSLGE